MKSLHSVLVVFYVYFSVYCINCSDITRNVFGKLTDGMPAAFGDFNSDELTDVFVLRDDGKTLEIFLAEEEEPLLRRAQSPLKCTFEDHITSVVPGDFDGDALMDVLVTVVKKQTDNNEGANVHTHVYMLWGGATYLNCTSDSKPILKMIGQPLTMDYNQDMIIDLFGSNVHEERVFWIFNKTRDTPVEIKMSLPAHLKLSRLRRPHSHAYLDLNDDHTADLFLTTKENFEVWYGKEKEGFEFGRIIPHPEGAEKIGQSLFIDVELRGRMDLVTPVCYDKTCKNSTLLVYCDGKWHNLQVNFKDLENHLWSFYHLPGSRYTNVITLHSGDFNMDGYPDILATLATSPESPPQSFLLENVACENGCGNFSRSFMVRWHALHPFKNGTVMAAFFDFYQDGILDVVLVVKNSTGAYNAAAFKNSLDYDANFIKVMVLTGLTNENNPMMMGRVGKKRRTYGTNLPGPRISYLTTTQEGNPRSAASAQLPQSAHFSLNLPYTIFGLGRTPNFVDYLTVGLSNHSRSWTQIIPNSQMVVIPWPTSNPNRWKAQLFVTPSKLILMSVAALTGVCVLNTIIIAVLHWKEKQEDKKERLSESHRFHFDAM